MARLGRSGRAFLLIASYPAMSALGQKQTSERAWRMSALPPKADILRGGADVR